MSTTAIATVSTHPWYFLLRRLHSLAGIAFGGFVCFHLLVNATLIQGPGKEGHGAIFNGMVGYIHSIPFRMAVEWSFIFLPILFHTIYGIYVMLNGKPNAGSYSYLKNWFYVLQRVSAILLVLFIAFHVFAMYGFFGKGLEFSAEHPYQSTVNHLQASALLSLVVYPIGVLASTFHMANGFWTAAIAWGLTVSNKAQTRFGWVCLAIFAFSSACGIAAIIGSFIHKGSM